MTTPLWCLLGFALWTVLLLGLGIVLPRVFLVLTGKARADSFPAHTPHGSERNQRTLRAHMNCVENLPVFGAIVLIAAVIGFKSSTFDLLALTCLLARILQSLVHIASGTIMAITIRFTFFAAQLACYAWMGWLLTQTAS